MQLCLLPLWWIEPESVISLAVRAKVSITFKKCLIGLACIPRDQQNEETQQCGIILGQRNSCHWSQSELLTRLHIRQA